MAEPEEIKKPRFGCLSKQDIDKKRAGVIPKCTKKANESAARAFQSFLTEKGVNTKIEELEPEELAEHLGSYYFNARTVDGGLYKRSSLDNFRHSLNRYLRAPPFNKSFDIIKDSVFREANDNFKAASAELKQEGKGETEHYPCIEDSDLQKLYSSQELNTHTPRGLFNKVQFDIRYYFCRRGQENVRSMTKDTFVVRTDADTGLKYVVKRKDELTKNHRGDDSESFSGFMPEYSGSELCPVRSFEKYVDKLHPKCDALWQRPKEFLNSSNSEWYYNAPVGEKTLKSFMKNLSIKIGLSRVYTNHSCRTTGATILSRFGFNNAQVMSVTGHKSVSSLAQYQRVSSEEKLNMGTALSSALLGPRPRLPQLMQSKPLRQIAPPQTISRPPPALAQRSMMLQSHCQQVVNVSKPSPRSTFSSRSNAGMDPILQSQPFMLPAASTVSTGPAGALSTVSCTPTSSAPGASVINFDLQFSAAQLEELFSPFDEVVTQRQGQSQQSAVPVVFSNCTFTGNVTFNTSK